MQNQIEVIEGASHTAHLILEWNAMPSNISFISMRKPIHLQKEATKTEIIGHSIHVL